MIYPIVDCLKKIGIALAVVYCLDSVLTQVTVFIYLSVMTIFTLNYLRPYMLYEHHTREMAEEVYIWGFGFFFLCLTDLVEDLHARDAVGRLMIAYVSVFLAVSLLVFAAETVRGAARSLRRWWLRRAAARARGRPRRNQVAPLEAEGETARVPLAEAARTARPLEVVEQDIILEDYVSGS